MLRLEWKSTRLSKFCKAGGKAEFSKRHYELENVLSMRKYIEQISPDMYPLIVDIYPKAMPKCNLQTYKRFLVIATKEHLEMFEKKEIGEFFALTVFVRCCFCRFLERTYLGWKRLELPYKKGMSFAQALALRRSVLGVKASVNFCWDQDLFGKLPKANTNQSFTQFCGLIPNEPFDFVEELGSGQESEGNLPEHITYGYLVAKYRKDSTSSEDEEVWKKEAAARCNAAFPHYHQTAAVRNVSVPRLPTNSVSDEPKVQSSHGPVLLDGDKAPSLLSKTVSERPKDQPNQWPIFEDDKVIDLELKSSPTSVQDKVIDLELKSCPPSVLKKDPVPAVVTKPVPAVVTQPVKSVVTTAQARTAVLAQRYSLDPRFAANEALLEVVISGYLHKTDVCPLGFLHPFAMLVLRQISVATAPATIAQHWFSETRANGLPIASVPDEVQLRIRNMKSDRLRAVYNLSQMYTSPNIVECELCGDERSHFSDHCVRYMTYESRVALMGNRCIGCGANGCAVGNAAHSSDFRGGCKKCRHFKRKGYASHKEYLCNDSVRWMKKREVLVGLACLVEATWTWQPADFRQIIAYNGGADGLITFIRRNAA